MGPTGIRVGMFDSGVLKGIAIMSDYPTNSQIVDSVGETNGQVLGNSPSFSMGILDTLMAETTGLMMNQAVVTQQNARISGSASLTAACAKMLRTPTRRQPEPPQPPAKPVSPLANQGQVQADISVNFTQAQSAINSLKQDLNEAENNRQNARDFLRSLANRTKSVIRQGLTPH